jgi:hypothetical protein
MISKLSGECYTLRSMFHISKTNMPKFIYFARYHSIMKYRIIFVVGGNSSNTERIFTLQKKIISRIMAGAKHWYTNRIYPRQCNHNESITLMVKLQVSTTSRCNYIGLNGKFLLFWRDGVSKPRSFYKAGIEKLVTRWETVIASNGNYIID